MDCYATNEHSVAVGEADEVASEALLCLWGVGKVVEVGEVEWEPEFAAIGLGAAHRLVFFPLYVANLGALYWAPHGSVAIDGAFACDADVGALACRD